jgi:hypothetical protein
MDVIDDLDYQYLPYSNRLATVNDFSDRDEGFKDGLNAINNINDYLYDTNGNMISDMNKEISLITYNHLNLPTRIDLYCTINRFSKPATSQICTKRDWCMTTTRWM